MEDLLNNGAILKRTTEESSSDRYPEFKENVEISLVGRDERGDVFLTQDSLTFSIGENILDIVVPGVMLVVKMMKEGERAECELLPRYGYGDVGFESVKPNEKVFFELKLNKIGAVSPEPDAIETFRQLFDEAEKYKTRGNWFFGREEYTKALRCYKEGLRYTEMSPALQTVIDARNAQRERGDALSVDGDAGNSDEDIERVHVLRVQCAQNISATFERKKMYKESREALVDVLTADPTNRKALVRAARICTMMSDFAEAKAALERLKTLFGDDQPDVLKEKKRYNAAFNAYKLKQKDTFGGFLKPVEVADDEEVVVDKKIKECEVVEKKIKENVNESTKKDVVENGVPTEATTSTSFALDAAKRAVVLLLPSIVVGIYYVLRSVRDDEL